MKICVARRKQANTMQQTNETPSASSLAQALCPCQMPQRARGAPADRTHSSATAVRVCRSALAKRLRPRAAGAPACERRQRRTAPGRCTRAERARPPRRAWQRPRAETGEQAGTAPGQPPMPRQVAASVAGRVCEQCVCITHSQDVPGPAAAAPSAMPRLPVLHRRARPTLTKVTSACFTSTAACQPERRPVDLPSLIKGACRAAFV